MVGLLMGIPLGRITKKSHKNHAGVADNPEKNLGNRRQTSKNPPGHSGRTFSAATPWMNNEDVQAFANAFSQQNGRIQELQAALLALQQQIAAGQQGQEPQRPDRHERRDLHEEVSQAIPPHLQLVSETSESDRKRILSKYPIFNDLPRAIEDTNKLAAPAIKDAATRRWIIDRLPKLQQRAIDITRVAAAAWDHNLDESDNNEQKLTYMLQAVKDVAILATSLAQSLAKTQLQSTLEAAGVPGAYSLLHLASDEPKIELSEHTIFQTPHIQAIKEFRSFSKTVQQQSVDRYKQSKNNYRRGGGFRGPSFGNRQQNSNSGYRGGYRGGGRGGYNRRGGRGGHRPRHEESKNSANDMD